MFNQPLPLFCVGRNRTFCEKWKVRSARSEVLASFLHASNNQSLQIGHVSWWFPASLDVFQR